MPFFSLSKNKVSQILNICNQISPKRDNIEVFTYTKFSIENNKLFLSVFNNQASYFAPIELNNFDNSNGLKDFLVKTDLLASSINLIQDEEVGFDIDLAKNTLTIQGSKAKHKLRINQEILDDFAPENPNSESLEISAKFKAEEIIPAIKSSFISVGLPKNVYEPKFLNICLTADPDQKQMFIVSTDRYRVIKNCIEVEYSNLKEDFIKKNYLLLPKVLQFFLASSGSFKEFTFNFGSSHLWIDLGDAKLVLRYGEGDYPDYDKILPQTFSCSFEITKDSFIESLKQVYLFAKDNTVNKSVILEVKPGQKQILLTSKTDKGEASEATLEIENYEGMTEDWTQSFNADYLMDYLNVCTSERIFWESNPGKPSVLSPKDAKDKQLYLVSGLK